MRWLAFEALSGRRRSERKADARRTAFVRQLPQRLVADGLASLAALLERPAAIQRARPRRGSDRAVAHIPQADAPTGAAALPFELRDETERPHAPASRRPGRDLRAAEEATGAELRTPRDQPAPARSREAARQATAIAPTRPLTIAIVNAAALADRAELAELHLKLEAELGSIRPVVARLAKRLLRVLMARQTRHWRFDLDEGVLDGSRLAALVASRGTARPFKQEGESPFPSTVVTLLIDHSGSMRGRPMLIAALTVEIFARVLERCGVRCEVLGFTTREWDGGEPAREWAANGYPENPGRLNALEHIVIKSADVPWRRARVALGLFLHDEMLKENIDGEALAWAHARLLARIGAPAHTGRGVRRHADGRSDARRQRPRVPRKPPAAGRRPTSRRGRRCSWRRSASATTCRSSTATPRRSRASITWARPSARS